MRFKKWNIGTPAERDVALLRSAGYPYLLSTVLAARGVTTAEAAAEALERVGLADRMDFKPTQLSGGQ